MNKVRRGQIMKEEHSLSVCVSSIKDLIEIVSSVRSDTEDIESDESDYRDNMPENLQGGNRYYDSEEASDELNSATSDMEEAISSLESAIDHLDNARSV